MKGPREHGRRLVSFQRQIWQKRPNEKIEKLLNQSLSGGGGR